MVTLRRLDVANLMLKLERLKSRVANEISFSVEGKRVSVYAADPESLRLYAANATELLAMENAVAEGKTIPFSDRAPPQAPI